MDKLYLCELAKDQFCEKMTMTGTKRGRLRCKKLPASLFLKQRCYPVCRVLAALNNLKWKFLKKIRLLLVTDKKF